MWIIGEKDNSLIHKNWQIFKEKEVKAEWQRLI